MEKIIPRWEWRTFGNDFGESESLIKNSGKPLVRESTEIYILSTESNDNTKIRDELMDIKTPLRINKNGLEQWTVVMKAGFPIHINDLAIVYKAFGFPLPYLEKDEYEYNRYLNILIGENPKLKPVTVTKKRFGYLIDEAIVEIAEVTFDGNPIRTIAVEHADPQLVLNTVKKLKLGDYTNINYIKAMKDMFELQY